MTKEKTKEAIKVMQAYVDGEKVEYRFCGGWMPASRPRWNWSEIDFRIAKPKAVELEVGMELAIRGYKDTFRRVVYIHGDYVCYTFGNGLQTASMSRLCRDFNVLINGKVHPILIKEPF